jgi:ribosomal-protein-serine acetyltransferase
MAGAEPNGSGASAVSPWLELSDASQLRLLAPSDAGELHRLIEANREYLARWLPWAAGQTESVTLDFIHRTRTQLRANDGFQLAIVQGGQIVGVIGFHTVDWVNRSTSIGYWIAAERQGQGTMTEATRALVDHAFFAWGLERVEIRAATGNERSKAIPERLGFLPEGTLRRVERVGDRYLDCVVYSMLAADWSD